MPLYFVTVLQFSPAIFSCLGKVGDRVTILIVEDARAAFLSLSRKLTNVYKKWLLKKSKCCPLLFFNFQQCLSYISNVKETPPRSTEHVKEFACDVKEISFHIDVHNKLLNGSICHVDSISIKLSWQVSYPVLVHKTHSYIPGV